MNLRSDEVSDEFNSVAGFNTIQPNAIVYMMYVTQVIEIAVDITDIEDFRRKFHQKSGVSFCTRAHFGKETNRETEKDVCFTFSGVNIQMFKKWSMCYNHT